MALKSMTSHLLSSLVSMRNWGYDSGLIDSHRLSRPTVSVGNLTFGGTGKTPVVDWLADLIEAKGFRAAVISRSYKANTKQNCIVEVDAKDAPLIYGDEPFLLAKKHPQATVAVGKVKWQVGQWLDESDLVKPDFYIIDDGYQHRALARDFNILLVDVSQKIEDLEVFPKGRGRESWESAKRADLIFFTKANQSNTDLIQQYRKLFENYAPVYELDFDYKLNQPLADAVLAVSGIAKPKSFTDALEQLNVSPVGNLPFSDHHRYTDADLKKIQSRAKDLAAEIITTEKDLVKLQARGLHPKYYLVVSVVPKVFPKELHEFINKVI